MLIEDVPLIGSEEFEYFEGREGLDFDFILIKCLNFKSERINLIDKNPNFFEVDVIFIKLHPELLQ